MYFLLCRAFKLPELIETTQTILLQGQNNQGCLDHLKFKVILKVLGMIHNRQNKIFLEMLTRREHNKGSLMFLHVKLQMIMKDV